MSPIQDHPLRYQLANELHARPFPPIQSPSTVVHIAIKKPVAAVGRDRDEDLNHLKDLLDRHGATHPQPGATHYSAQLGRHVLKWEQHTEFVTYTAFFEGVSARAFDKADFELFSSDWLERAPGVLMTSIALRVCPLPVGGDVSPLLSEWFVPESLAVSRILDGAAIAAGDFRIDPAGHMRFALFAGPDAGERRVGRAVQRLLEIETYKSMSMLGFSRAQELSAPLGALDTQLSDLMAQMATDAPQAEDMLNRLLSISAKLESMAARASFRFGATGAYEAIVSQRISSLREGRIEGQQSFGDFMVRRYDPAMRTVKSTQGRLQALADRAMRAGDLLRTRVDVERSAQNQALLASMDRRADLALRLQHTVEGLSVVAISYYAVSLVSYALYPLAALFDLSKGLLTALVTVPVVALVWWSVRRIKKHLD